MKKSLILFAAALALMACGGNNGGKSAVENDSTQVNNDSTQVNNDSTAVENDSSVMEVNVLVPKKVAEEGAVEDAAADKEAMEWVALKVIQSDGYNKDFGKYVTKAFARKVAAGEPIMTLHGFDIMDIGLYWDSMKVKSSDLSKGIVIVTGKAEEPNYDDETTEKYDVSWQVTLVKENGNWLVSAVKLL